eukprot:TRINITY_DN11691_c0_g1_i5.p1 TRINITY_DN11691_c0_g1~~TRINITY_DN11691_c0_g1_i5.p1  ORF type:complete len:436 (+),score=136.95 TRINITY_DN11691_c0_g1_i5:190-1497(+)
MTKGGLRKIVLEAIDKQYLRKKARGIDTKRNAEAALKEVQAVFDTVWKNSFSTYPWMPELWAKHLQQMTDRRVLPEVPAARSASDTGRGSKAAPPSVSAADGGEDDERIDAQLPPCKVFSRQRDMRQLYFLTKAEELRSHGEFCELLALPGFKLEDQTQFLAMTHLGRREMQSAQTTLQHMTTKEERDAFFAGDDAALKEAQAKTQAQKTEYAKLVQESETASALEAAEATRMTNELEAVKLEAKTKSEEAAEKLRGAEEQIAKLSAEMKETVAAQEAQAQTTLDEVRAEAAAKLSEAEEQITKLRAQLADKTSAAGQAQEEAAVKSRGPDEEIAKLRARVDAMTDEAASFQQREADMQRKLVAITRDLERCRMGAEDAAERSLRAVNERDGKIRTVESELQTARGEKATARQQLDKCQKELEKEVAAKKPRQKQ